MPETLDEAKDSIRIVVRRVRVFAVIAVLMVATMTGDPFEQGALNRHRTQDAEGELDDAVGLERAMREQTMKSHRDAHCGQQVHAHQKGQFDPGHSPPPEGDDGADQAGKRQNNREQRDDTHRHRLTRIRFRLVGGEGSFFVEGGNCGQGHGKFLWLTS